MKLPKKYAGITPGEWKRDGGLGYGHLVGPDIAVVYGGPVSGKEAEGEPNADLIADSPRLAAAVVELRSVLDALIFTADSLWNDVPIVKAHHPATVTHPVIAQAQAVLASTEEWRA